MSAASRIELSDGGSLDYDWLIVATGSKHAYFGHDDWEPNAPGLKTLEDAIAIRRRILIAFERAEREEDARRQRDLLTFVIVGGGPTGVELAGTLAEIARQTLRDEFRIDRYGARPHPPGRSRTDDPADVPREPAQRRARLARAPRHRGSRGYRRDRGRFAWASWSAPSASTRERCCGQRASRHRRW